MISIKQKIIPHLWFDKEAKKATHLYCSIFPGSEVISVTQIYDMPSGACDIAALEKAYRDGE